MSLMKQYPHLQPFLYSRAMAEQGVPFLLRTGQIIPFAKPLDWTSFDLVNKFRHCVKYASGLRKIKVGHAGTLDPKATGVLIICTGKCTKHIEELMTHSKEYVATLQLGATTPSFDSEMEPDAFFPYEHITKELLQKALLSFSGWIEQVPPIFSATSVNGKRAYDLAREGKEVTLKAKRVFVESIVMENFSLPFVTLRIRCGKGTYIRSIARDLGVLLQSGAFLTSLQRTEVGGIGIDECFTTEDFTQILRHIAPSEEGYEEVLNVRPLLY